MLAHDGGVGSGGPHDQQVGGEEVRDHLRVDSPVDRGDAGRVRGQRVVVLVVAHHEGIHGDRDRRRGPFRQVVEACVDRPAVVLGIPWLACTG